MGSTSALILPRVAAVTWSFGQMVSVLVIFAGLVGAVIVGFFSIALQGERVRYSIFSQDTGIQFVTLFVLVIAIILFGVVGILGDKELAALLGGLSVYILGRGNVGAEAAGQATQPAAPLATPALTTTTTTTTT